MEKEKKRRGNRAEVAKNLKNFFGAKPYRQQPEE